MKRFVILTLEGFFFLVSAVYGRDFSTSSLTRVVGASPGRVCMYVRAFFFVLFCFFSDVGGLIFSGCLLVTTKVLRALCCFRCHGSESDGS